MACGKRVLFINPSRGMRAIGFFPHLGLGYLSAVLKGRGHKVLVLDYNGKRGLPHYSKVIDNFNPEVIGLSTYSASWSVGSKIIEDLKKYQIPIMVGGSHASCYCDDLSLDNRIDYIIKGEAEDVIVEIVESARHLGKPQIIGSDLPGVDSLPFPDFTSFHSYESIDGYPLMTSRGCPYSCSFCAVSIVSSRKWRARKIDKCINELEQATEKLPNLSRIVINDDNFTLQLERAKEFLEIYLTKGFKPELQISNIRADKIDRELLSLIKRTGCKSVGIGIEHVDPEVYRHINKGEAFGGIEKAVRMIKEAGLGLTVCMIIGLPYDSYEKTKKSIKYVKEIRADRVFWNMLSTFKGTRAREWFVNHGRIYSDTEQGFQASDKQVICDEPSVETPEFTREERKKAYLLAIIETGMFGPRHIVRLVFFAFRYGLFLKYLLALGKKLRNRLFHVLRLRRVHGNN